MIAYDEKELTNQFLCMSAKVDPHVADSFDYMQANSIYEVTREHLREIGEEGADQKYFINAGRRAVFRSPADRSLAEIDTTFGEVVR